MLRIQVLALALGVGVILFSGCGTPESASQDPPLPSRTIDLSPWAFPETQPALRLGTAEVIERPGQATARRKWPRPKKSSTI